MDDKMEAIEKELRKHGINDDDIIEKFVTGGGPGGQKINKTQNCVYLKHVPSGIEVKCQRARSRELNRLYARRMLLDKIKSQVLKLETAKMKEIDKLRKQKKRRSRKTKEKLLESKRTRSSVKKNRSSTSDDDS